MLLVLLVSSSLDTLGTQHKLSMVTDCIPFCHAEVGHCVRTTVIIDALKLYHNRAQSIAYKHMGYPSLSNAKMLNDDTIPLVFALFIKGRKSIDVRSEPKLAYTLSGHTFY